MGKKEGTLVKDCMGYLLKTVPREGKARPACEVHIVTSDGARKHAGIHLDRPFLGLFFFFFFAYFVLSFFFLFFFGLF